jgi:hypothetical protein
MKNLICWIFFCLCLVKICRSSELTAINDKFYQSSLLDSFFEYYRNKSPESWNSFSKVALENFHRYPIECLNFVNRQVNRKFKSYFWGVMYSVWNSNYVYCRLSSSSLEIFDCMSKEIEKNLLCVYENEQEKEAQFEVTENMVRIMKEMIFKMGSRNSDFEEYLRAISVWTFLLRHLSFDYDNKSIDINSLLLTFSRIKVLIKSDYRSIPEGTDRLHKICYLFIFYLENIRLNNFELLFELKDFCKAPLLYLFRKMVLVWCVNNNQSFATWELLMRYFLYDFNELFTQSGHYDYSHIRKFIKVKSYLLSKNQITYKLSETPKSFTHLIHLLGPNLLKKHKADLWEVRVIYELEKVFII